MALGLTEEHLALADSVRGWAAHTAPPAAIRAGLESEDRGAAHYRDTLRPGVAAEEAGSGVLESLIKGMAAGTLTAAVALAPGIRASDDAASSGGLVIDGSCGPVLGGCFADLLILPAGTGEGQSWVAVDAADLEITPLDSLDLT